MARCAAGNPRVLLGINSHAVHFREHEGRDAVTVHP